MADKETKNMPSAGRASEGGTPDPQNMNKSASPGGDGVQSSASEKAAADAGRNQPVEQRVNAAIRREQGEGEGKGSAGKEEQTGSRPSLVQAPGQVLPYEESLNRVEPAPAEVPNDLPAATRAEMDAGKAALEGRSQLRPNPTNPVDDANARAARSE